MINSTFSDNFASGWGGAINTWYGPSVTITNSTFNGNNGSGGAVHNFGTPTVIANSTFYANTGGAIGSFSTTSVENTIVANSPGANCPFGGLTSLGYNLSSDTSSCGFTSAGDQVGVDAQLTPLGDYGGSTKTYGLCTGAGAPDASCTGASPALDAANNASCPATDQRGIGRPQPVAGSCDIGAYERVPVAVCGDGSIDATEQCDDGNLVDGDCCSSTCQFDAPGAACTDPYDTECHPSTPGAGECNGAGVCTGPVAADGTECSEDGDPCTLDQCSSGSCIHPAGNDGAACADDGSVCTSDTCLAGSCDHPAANEGGSCPDDGDPCTADQCSSGSCAHPAGNDGAACADDGNVCTADQCLSGTCDHPAANDGGACPDDGEECTDDLCNAGACDHQAVTDGIACDDSSACTATDTCQTGVCNGADSKVCCDGGTCEPDQAACVSCPAGYTPGGGGCQKSYTIDASLLDNLNLYCSGSYSCGNAYGFHWADTGDAGVGDAVRIDLEIRAGMSCSSQTRNVYLDGGAAPIGSFAPGAGCFTCGQYTTRTIGSVELSSYAKGATHSILTDTPSSCDGFDGGGDGTFAIVTVTYESFPAASPLPSGTPCGDDNNECTDGPHTCDGSGICTGSPTNEGGACDDSDACTHTDLCVAGTCVGADPTVCCNSGTCDPGSGTCSNCPVGYTDTGSGCQKTYLIDSTDLLDNLNDYCSSVDIRYGSNPNPIGFHWYDTGDAGVGPVVQLDLQIEAGLSCTGATRDVILNGAPPAIGSYAPGGNCNNCGNPGSATRLVSTMDVGAYVKGGLNGVLTDYPGNAEGLTRNASGNFASVAVTYAYLTPPPPPLPSGTSCNVPVAIDDCHPVTGPTGECDGSGICATPAAPDGTSCTDDGDPCTVDECGSGSCQHVPGNDGGACADDGDPCTVDQCGSGSCQHLSGNDGAACADDGSVCTADQCESGSCVHPAINEGGSCPDDGSPCTADQCESGSCAHPATNEGGSCADDGNECTLDQCQSGYCGHPAVSDGAACTDDGNNCTLDQCGSGSCTHSVLSNGTPCDDASACTQSDTCESGECVGTDPVLCAQCTNETCDPSTGACVVCPAGYTPGGGGCQKSYLIDDPSDLDGLAGGCSQDQPYSGSSNPFGFHWLDGGDGNVGAVTRVDLQLESSVGCGGARTLDVSLNGDTFGSYPSADNCACGSYSTTRSVGVASPPTYSKGAANSVSISGGNYEGFNRTATGTYAVVVVTYENPGGTPLEDLPDGSLCDDSVPGNGCDSCVAGDCTEHHVCPVCGNGSMEFGEACDDGNLDGSDCCSASCEVETGQIITTVAGGSGYGYGGDGGPATAAYITYPYGMVIDTTGNLFFADPNNLRIRKVDTSGTITTVAGDGNYGSGGDGGPATSAQLAYPRGVAMDAAGNLFFADQNNHRVRKVDTFGTITTVAGDGNYGFGGDGGSATSAQLAYPNGVAVDAAGNLFIADQQNQRIRMVDTVGTITTVAGDGNYGFGGDGGSATSAQLAYPAGLAVDTAGNLFIADNSSHRIRKITSGIISTVAGDGSSSFGGDGGPATSAQLAYPSGVAVDAAGNLFIADANNNRVRKVDTFGTITTVAGSSTAGSGGDGGSPTAAQLYNPVSVALDAAGNLLIADHYNARVRKLRDRICATDVCGDGVIGGSESCDDGNVASGDCCSSSCQAESDGGSCDDSNACTQTDTCQSGTCTGSSPVTCAASDQCHTAGTCNPTTGACSNPNAGDGVSCDDSNACTQTDMCQSGTCTGSSPVTCAASDQCHTAGTCNPTTGTCSNPNAGDGVTCDDSNACTQTDTCQSGTCTGSSPVTCTASDQCHTAGTCNPTTGACSNPLAPGGMACGSTSDTDCDNPDTCDGNGACLANIEPAGVLCTDEGETCTDDECDGSGACTHPPIPLAAVCNWSVIAGSDTEVGKVRTRVDSEVDGSVCADTADVGGPSTLLDGSSWALLSDTGTAARVRLDAAVLSGRVATGGGCLSGVQGTLIFGTLPGPICCADGDVELPGGNPANVINACGTDPLLGECALAKAGIPADIALLNGLPPTQTLGIVAVPPGGSVSVLLDAGLNVIDIDRLVIGPDGSLIVDAQNNADAVVVLRMADGFRSKVRGTILLAGGALPENLLVYAADGACTIGKGGVGAGTLFCPAGRVRLKQSTIWDGAIAGGSSVEIGWNVVLTHVPFLGLAQ